MNVEQLALVAQFRDLLRGSHLSDDEKHELCRQVLQVINSEESDDLR